MGADGGRLLACGAGAALPGGAERRAHRDGARPRAAGPAASPRLVRRGEHVPDLRSSPLQERLRVANHIELDPPDQPTAARRADALVWICEAVLGESGSTEAPSAPPARIVVHADYDLLTGANPAGRGHLEDGPALSTNRLRGLGCDATIKTLIERDGVPLASGREKPAVPPDMKFRVRNRDGICRYPGCAIPATRCEAHHIHHWFDGGPTKDWNILSLCSHHHDRHHDGEFEIHRTPEGDLRFVGRDGTEVGTVTGGHWNRPRNRAGP
ncbi:MAG: DUF222 domain-containing protein [Chloroflexi bacterium]|nr:MAG: DUF222 domain-containing protein [Chloroflexota bacterium]